ncbi:hypothetical protein ACFL6I_28730 [candidate division KSB1 bacterium]
MISEKINSKDENNNKGCIPAVIDNQTYNNITPGGFTIDTAYIINDDLNVTLSYYGRNDDVHAILYSNNCIFETLPLQRDIRILFKNNNPVNVVLLKKDFCFELLPIQAPNANTMIFNLEGWNQGLLYNY